MYATQSYLGDFDIILRVYRMHWSRVAIERLNIIGFDMPGINQYSRPLKLVGSYGGYREKMLLLIHDAQINIDGCTDEVLGKTSSI